MKHFIGLMCFLLLFGEVAKANMSSPIMEGTLTSSAISSKDIQILSERIFIKIDPNFSTAKFIVEYTIQSDLSGKQIPLLFYARDFKDSFFVWLDNKRINIQNIPDKHYEGSPFSGFEKSLEKDNDEDEIIIYWQKGSGSVYKLSDLKYFEADIEKGVHQVRVEYTANVWTDLSGWVKSFSFRYSLTPAKYWKSFGSLEVIVEQEGQVRPVSTNLGLPNEKQIREKNSWTFNKLPGEYVEISYTPKTSRFANALMTIEPVGMAVIAMVVMAILHCMLTLFYRKRNIQKRYSLPVIMGSILVPFLTWLVYMYSFDIIDDAIGEDASRFHGYVFLSIIFYPVILIVYGLLFWLIDRQYKRKLLQDNGGSR
jgi:hypothetical protein